VNSAAAVTGLGAALMLYGLVSLAPVRLGLPAAAEPWLGPIVGILTGIVTALTGVFVLPAVPYLQSLRLDPDDLVQGLGLSFTVSTLALGVALAADGQVQAPHLGASLFGLVAAIAGMWLGQMLRTRMRPASFRLWFLLGLIALGAHLMLRAVL
jgi:uncharacterized membrane protein YfcA